MSRLLDKGCRALTLGMITAGLCVASFAHAQDEKESVSLGVDPALGLDPSLPQSGALPAGQVLRTGEAAGTDWRFDFHGLLIAPLRVGLNDRDTAGPGQSTSVLHSPPVVPDDLETFSHTGVVPNPYGQLNFSYGNNLVVGTATILARETSVSSGFFDPPSQAGVNDLFLTVTPKLPGGLGRATIYVGAFSNRYGVPGEYDEGRYGTPLIARINGMGENIVLNIGLGGDMALMVEQGFQGQTNKASTNLVPAGYNDFADSVAGSSFVNHFHLGLAYQRFLTFGAHYLKAWAQDDRSTGPIVDAQGNATGFPDGNIEIIGADLRLNMGRFGHLYGAFSHVDATSARVVGRIVEVLNTRGGKGLMDNYFGPGTNGTGKLTVIGGQYDLSIGRLISYPVPFGGDGPDLYVSLFGMSVGVSTDDPTLDADGSNPLYDVSKLKYGIEGTYSVLPWLALSTRYDQVAPTLDNSKYSFAVLSPRVILRTGWQAHDQVVLQYSRWFNGSYTTARSGYPPVDDITVVPDEDVLSISANMWW
jgi:hypothetical protein